MILGHRDLDNRRPMFNAVVLAKGTQSAYTSVRPVLVSSFFAICIMTRCGAIVLELGVTRLCYMGCSLSNGILDNCDTAAKFNEFGIRRLCG